MDALAADGRLVDYQPYWAARAALLARTHAYPEARDAFDIAIGLASDPAVRRFLQGRQAALPRCAGKSVSDVLASSRFSG